MKKRIYNSKVNIDKDKLRLFFENRSTKFNEENPFVTVMYQDNNPGIAKKRDSIEKDKIMPILKFQKDSIVLDVGCGIGRWADPIYNEVREYHGTDFSEELISIAKSRFQGFSNVSFYNVDYSSTPDIFKKYKGKITHLIICGVFQYINDEELIRGMKKLLDLCSKNAVIYVKTAVAKNERLTLSEYWSEELQADYSAIYRTVDEYTKLFKDLFEINQYRMLLNEELGNGTLRNRAETWQNLFVLKR